MEQRILARPFKYNLAEFEHLLAADFPFEQWDHLWLERYCELARFHAHNGHPLDLFPDIQWDKYCHIANLGKHFGERVKVCGLTFADRIAYQEDGQPMKFISLCDYTGFVETELFAAVYRAFGMETVKSPIIEIEGLVETFENEKGYTLRVIRVRIP